MSAPSPAPLSRPRIVNVGIWLTLVGAAVLTAGGLSGVTTAVSLYSSPGRFSDSLSEAQTHQILLVYGGFNALLVVAGLAVGFLTGRVRNGDKRFRRTLIALVAVVVVIFFIAALVATYSLELLSLIAVIPVAVGATLFTRPAANVWFDAVEEQAQSYD